MHTPKSPLSALVPPGNFEFWGPSGVQQIERQGPGINASATCRESQHHSSPPSPFTAHPWQPTLAQSAQEILQGKRTSIKKDSAQWRGRVWRELPRYPTAKPEVRQQELWKEVLASLVHFTKMYSVPQRRAALGN